MTYGRHIYQTASDMAMATIFSYPTSQQTLPHWNSMLFCCEQCTCIDIPSQESYKLHSNKCSTISFNVYNLIARCTVHRRHQLDKKNIRLL